MNSELERVSVDSRASTIDWTTRPATESTLLIPVPTNPSFDSFQKIAKATTTKIAAHLGLSASTHAGGARSLCNAILQRYGQDVADSVAAQLQISNTDAKPLGSYVIKKAVKLSEKLALNRSNGWTEYNDFSCDANDTVSAFEAVPLIITRCTANNVEGSQKEFTISAAKSKKRGAVQLNTTLAPASQNEVLKKSYQEDKIQGVSSKDAANPKHSINLWRDTFVIAGKTLFSCVRSGLLAAMKISSGEERKAVFDKRLDENIVMALEGGHESVDAQQRLQKGVSEDNPIPIDLLDIGLLSNYNFFGFGSENKMKKEQFRMLDAANGVARKVSYKNSNGSVQTIWVRPTIHAINIGVQRGDGLFASSNDIAKTAKTTKAICARATDYLSTLPGSELEDVEKSVIQELLDQCQELTKNQTYLSENGGDYYALPARLALLADKVGIRPPMIHCKSGKDRTARLIEEVKLLALQIESNSDRLRAYLNKTPSSAAPQKSDRGVIYQGLVPSTGALSREQKQLLAAIAMNSGNQKVQELNTGVIGNKQGWQLGKRLGVYGIAGLFPNAALRKVYKEYTGSSSGVDA